MGPSLVATPNKNHLGSVQPSGMSLPFRLIKRIQRMNSFFQLEIKSFKVPWFSYSRAFILTETFFRLWIAGARID
jgi:hypothetical protein